MVDIIINGCGGKMGKVVAEIAKNDGDVNIVAGVDPFVTENKDFPVFTSFEECDVKADAVVDFSTATAVPALLDYCEKTGTACIVCTTGLSQDTLNRIEALSQKIPVFKSANMSLGVNLLAKILKKYAYALYEAGFDVEIVERHHNQKADAPSGTALMLADAVNESVENKLNYIFDRSPVREKRDRKQLGISAVRGGTIVGDHEVIFAGRDEVVEFKHSAYSKEVFAVGAIKAAKFIKDKPAGKYDMQDVTNEV